MKNYLKFSAVTAAVIMGVMPNLAFSADTYDIQYDSVNDRVVVYKQSYANNPIIPTGNYFMPADYFVYGDQAYYAQNTVNVDIGSTTLEFVYAGYDSGANGQGASSNTLNFNSGNIDVDIIGGLAEKNAANFNKVFINGGNVKKDAVGGLSLFQGAAVQNSVTMRNGKVEGFIYGGEAIQGDARNNSVTIEGGEVLKSVYGGYSQDGIASDNTVTIKGGIIRGSVFGGSSRNKYGINNNVIISGGTIEGDVGDAKNIDILGGSIGGNVYNSTGDTTDTIIRISNGNIVGNVNGKNTRTAIYISGGTINGNVLNSGKETHYESGEIKGYIDGVNQNGNTLYIISGANSLKARNIFDFSNINFYLPSSATHGYTALNLTGTGITNLDNTRIVATLKDATGLTKDSKIHLIKTAGSIINFDETKTNASLTNVDIAGLMNIAGKIVLSDEKTLDLVFIGNPIPIGWSYTDQTYNIISKTEFTRNTTDGLKTFNIVNHFDNGEMTEQSNNTINMNFGDISTDGRFYGGVGDNDSTNNTINISVNSLSGNNIYGGYSEKGNATNNTINFIKGDLKSAVSLYGGFSADSSKDMVTGNTLNIGTASTPTAMNLRARNILNFETINFYLPSNVANNSVALNLYGSGETDLTKTTISVDNLNSYLDGTGNKYYLLKNTSTGTISVDENWLTSTQTIGNVFNVIGNTQYNVAKGGIFQSADKKDLYITSTANLVETITGDTFGDDEAGIKDGIKVNLENSDYAKLNINIANSATINLTNAHNVGSVISSGSTLDIKGGSTFDTGASIDVKTANFGDSSDAMVMDIYDISALKAKEINFYLPSNVANGETALKVANSVDLSDTKVNAYLKDATGITSKDDKIHLIQTAGSITGFAEANGNANLTNVNIAGLINVTGKIAVDSTAKNLDLTFNGDPDTGGGNTGGGGSTGGGSTGGGSTGGGSGTGGATANEGAKTLLETKLSQNTAVNEGANLLVSNLGNIANSANNANSALSANGANSTNSNLDLGKAVTFAFVSGYDKEMTTGSHIDIKGFNANAGIAGNDYFSSGNLTTGLFVEYGKGEYDSFLDDGTKGSGKTEFIGGGAFARFTTLNNFYTEVSGRVGQVKTEYETTAAYKGFDISNTYYGAHLGLGKIFELTSSNDLDIFARGIWAKTAGNDLDLNGINTHFDSVTSLRAQVGFKDSFKLSDTSKLYAGAAYQYEFDGEAKGTLSVPALNAVADIASPKLKGSTGIGEIGYVYENSSIKFEAGAKGYVGKEKGYSGNLGVTFKF